MTLQPGTRLGAYEILAPLGVGGMGEVYRARDTMLGRDVAIKVLPADVAKDAERLARFKREAQLLASLNHPNIATIYGIEETGGIHALVMELVEGDDLSALIARGPLPLAEALPIAKQIAEALETAHEQGIVHRDLKPANIKVRADGTVKVLDFGLAKAMDPAGSSSAEVVDSPTLTARPTQLGMLLGTVAYMSPEQARGKAVDRRADIWAFGVVLYEMLTGRRLFAGEEISDVLAAVLRQDIDLGVLPAETPARIRRLLGRCLDRDVKHRLRDIGEARVAVQDELAGPEEPTGALSSVAANRRGARWLPWAAPALAVVAGALFLLVRFLGGLEAKAPAGPQIVSFSQVTDLPGVETMPSLSPDGKSLVYAKTVGSDTALYLLRIGGRNAVRLSPDPPAHDMQPAFSPDGERIAFRSDRDVGGVFLMTASGESVTRLTDFGYTPGWSPDGAEIVVSPAAFTFPTDRYSIAKGLSIVNVNSGQTRELAINGTVARPSWSPGGARIAYWGLRGDSGQRDIWTVAADGSDVASGGVSVTNDAELDWSPTWSPDGRYLYFSSARGGTMNLWRVPIDERSGQVLGEFEPVTTPSKWSGDLSFSRDGTRLAFASLDFRSTLFKVAFDAAREAIVGQPTPLVKGTRAIRDHELSPDGEWVAFNGAGVQEDLFVARTDGTQYRRLTDDAFRDRGPAWAPDGTRIAFYSDRSGVYEQWTIRPDGSGLAQLTHGTVEPGFPVWSPDGERVAFGLYRWHIVDARSPSTAPPPEPALNPTKRFHPTSWSPMGDRIAGFVLTIEGLVAGLDVYTLATKQYAPVPGSLASGQSWLWPIWLADGRRLIVRRPDGVFVLDAETGAGHQLIAVGGYVNGKSVGVSHDNRWITYTETAIDGDIWLATLKK